jgi:3-deoxy-manno-octulosonate cytidylyltransferase (CMP-KDO synthetase)
MKTDSNILAVIPSRFSSSRFPGKPLLDLKGKTMIQRVYEGVLKSNLINHVIVATDDVRIYDEVVRFGGNVMMTSENHRSGTDRCAEVATEFNNSAIIVNVQGDEPLVDYRQLEQLIRVFENPDVKIATLASKNLTLEDLNNPNRIKVVTDKNFNALYFSRSCIPNYAHSTENPLTEYPYLRHIGLYAYRRKTLLQLTQLEPTLLERTESLEQLRWLFHGHGIRVVETEIETPNIDVPEDVEIVLNHLN